MLLFRFSSLPFPFYQQFNPLFNGISTPLSIGRSILARWGPGTWPGGRGTRAPKCFDHLIKGRLYWISHSIMDSTLDKRGKPLNNRSIYWDKRDLMIFFLFRFLALYCMYGLYVWRLFASLPSRPPGAKNNGRHNLLIQGHMQIFEKK